MTDYQTAQPHWQTVLDYDALGRRDNEKWVQKGRTCLYPDDEICMVALSAGGEDAITLREFNLKAAAFVEGGFALPRSKQNIAWVDKDSLLIARDWGAGTMTRSGLSVRHQHSGNAERSSIRPREVYRSNETDVRAILLTLHDARRPSGHPWSSANINFFETEVSLLTPAGPRHINLPGKSEIEGLLNGQLIVSLNQDWMPGNSARARKFLPGFGRFSRSRCRQK